MSDLAPLLQGFFTDKLMLQRQASPHTVAAYRDTFKLLLGFLAQRTSRSPAALSITDLDAPAIGAFLPYDVATLAVPAGTTAAEARPTGACGCCAGGGGTGAGPGQREARGVPVRVPGSPGLLMLRVRARPAGGRAGRGMRWPPLSRRRRPPRA